MSKKKICFIAQFPPPIHGLSKAVETLYNSKLAKKFDFERINITQNKNFLKNILLIWKSKSDLFYFTISQTKGGNLRDLVILKFLNLLKKKCLIHLHGGYYRKLVDTDISSWQRKMNYEAISKIDGAVVLSDSLKNIFCGMMDEKKIHVVSNCVDDKFLMSDAEFKTKQEAVEKKKIFDVLYLSNFIKSKGYPKVLQMAKIEKDYVDVGGERQFHFHFAGKFFKKSERDFFYSYVKENNLENFITYHGMVTGDKKRQLLKKCDIFTLLTRYSKEGQPISILEAMGNGMIIVTTDHAGIPDIVKDGVNGIVVTKEREDARNIFLQLHQLRINAKQILYRNRTKCLKNYTEQSYVDKIKEIFETS